MAAHRRFYYYLTADERTGELMTEEKDADFALLNLDPMRAYYPKDQFPTHARSGPDWAAFCSNWMAMWERFGDTAYRDKILKGIECLKKMPLRLISGTTFGYDPSTGALSFFTEESGGHLMICQGAPEIWMELNRLIDDPEWENMMAEYGRFYQLSPEERARRSGVEIKKGGFSFPFFAASMTAFAAVHDKDRALAEKVWDILFNDPIAVPEGNRSLRPFKTTAVAQADSMKPMEEFAGISTNTVAQWSLNVIQCLELIGSVLDTNGQAGDGSDADGK
jgi:hypothetical protein